MFKFLKKHETGWYILMVNVGRFSFRWFTDCGEWFVYLLWYDGDRNRTIRLSSAGCYNEVWPRTKEDEHGSQAD